MMPKLEVRQLRMVWSICVECSTEVEREKSVKPNISYMVDRIKEVNEKGCSRVMLAIS